MQQAAPPHTRWHHPAAAPVLPPIAGSSSLFVDTHSRLVSGEAVGRCTEGKQRCPFGLLLYGVGLSLVAITALFVLRVANPPPHDIAPAPEFMALARQAGDENALSRGNISSSLRRSVTDVFNGTHIQGRPLSPSLPDFMAMVHEEPGAGYFGLVVLSPGAGQLRAALEASGFSHGAFYHGSKNMWISSILSGGFLVSDGWHGEGIYVAETFAHAQCYAGPGQPILRLDIYWKPDNKDRYLKKVQHDSMINDVWLVSDPLVVIPREVMRCCPEKLECLRRLQTSVEVGAKR